MRPLVSIIIPTYNRVDFLKEAVHSVESQTYSHVEIILVDDGSTDATHSYMSSLHYQSLFIPHSGKPGYVRNRGISHAQGDYIAFLDSDDLWEPEKTAKQMDFFLHHPHIRICHTREIWKRKDKIISQKTQTHQRSGYIFEDALKKCIIGPSTVMVHRNALQDSGLFHPELEIAEDYELWLRITAREKVGYIDEPLVIKQAGHPGQLSEKYGHIEYFRIQALESVINQHILSGPQQKLALGELIRKCIIYSRGCIKRGKHSEAEKFDIIMEKYKKELEKYNDFNKY
jgi:glycosyltransferase involved in cell wall biosynthesis